MITKQKPIFILLLILLMLTLTACGGGSKKIDTSNNNDANAENNNDANADKNKNDEPAVDYDATSDALAATADAIAAAEKEPTAVPPTDAPSSADEPAPSSVPPTEPSGSNSFTSDEYIWYTEFESFEDEADKWTLFTIYGGANYSALVNEGYLTVTLDDPDEALYIINDYIWMDRGQADVLVEIGFDNVGARTNKIAVVCRATDKGWYEFGMGADGLWYIWKYTSGVGYEQLANGGISGYNKNVTDHVLLAACIDDYLAFTIDGVIPKNGEVYDSEFKEGQIGMVFTSGPNGGVEVDIGYFWANYAE